MVLGQLLPRKVAPNPTSNPNAKPNPNSNRGAIFLGGNCPDTAIPFTIRIFARYEVLIRKSVNVNIRISFYKGFENEITYNPSKYI